MLGLFKAKLPIDADEFEWMLACFKWFETEFGDRDRLRSEMLALPGPEAFPHSRAQGHARALELFEVVRPTHRDGGTAMRSRRG